MRVTTNNITELNKNDKSSNSSLAILVLNDHDEGKESWGVSFDGPNPDLENYVECLCEEDAFRLKDLVLELISRTNTGKIT